MQKWYGDCKVCISKRDEIERMITKRLVPKNKLDIDWNMNFKNNYQLVLG